MTDDFDGLLADQPTDGSPLATALRYIAAGWSPVPIPYQAKGPPELKQWGLLRLKRDTAARHFNGKPQNIGVILGEASGGLVDIDLDCPEARMMAPAFLPATDAIFGRQGNPESHWLYSAHDMVTEQIKFPGTRKTLLELRSNSQTDQPVQTVFPGSVHEEGDPIRWHRDGKPATVNAAELLSSFHRLAAATIVARAFPTQGSGRHDATLSLIGLLTRAGRTEAEVVDFVSRVRASIGADAKKPLVKMARDAANRFAADKSLFGLPVFKEAFGEKAADRFCELLPYEPNNHETHPDEFPDEDELDDAATASPEPAPRLRFLSPGECSDAPLRGYVIKGLLAPGDVGCIYGAPGAGKSLIAPHLGYAVAQGRTAFGMRTKPGRVFYVAAEDPHGMRGRVSALKLRHGDGDGFTLVEGVSDLLEKSSPDMAALMAAVKEKLPSLIFIDTLAMAFPGLEENSADAMGRVVATARRLASRGAAVVLIHHDTKAGTPTPRGHSLLNGALDVALQLFARDEQGVVRGKLSKNRNGACDRDVAFRIATEAMGEDEDGDIITVALVDELDAAAAKPKQKLTPAERAALLILADMVAASGGCPVAEDDWRTACIDARTVSASDDRESRRKATKRAFEGLTRKSAVVLRDKVASIPDIFTYSHSYDGDAFDDADDDADS